MNETLTDDQLTALEARHAFSPAIRSVIAEVRRLRSERDAALIWARGTGRIACEPSVPSGGRYVAKGPNGKAYADTLAEAILMAAELDAKADPA